MNKKIAILLIQLLIFPTLAWAQQADTPNQDFESLFQSQFNHPQNDFAKYMDRTLAIFYRAHAYSLEFDQELQQRVLTTPYGIDIIPMTTSIPYKKLMVMRLLTERQHDTIIYFYARLLEEAATHQRDRDGIGLRAEQKITQLISALQSKWDEDPVGRMALLALVSEIKIMRHNFLLSQGRSVRANAMAGPVLSTDDAHRVQLDFSNSIEEVDQRARIVASSADPEFEIKLRETQVVDSIGKGLGPYRGTDILNLNGNSFSPGTWALTYDDGPSLKYTPLVLDMLKKNGIKVTFFWLAKNVANTGSVIQRAIADGHDLGNHSYNHEDLSKRSADLNLQIVKAQQILTTSYGFRPRYFRCPYGSCIFVRTSQSQLARKMIAQEGMIHVLWNVDSNDWKPDTVERVFQRTKNQIEHLSNGIILFHDIHERSYYASTRIVQEVLKKKETIKMVKMSDVAP